MVPARWIGLPAVAAMLVVATGAHAQRIVVKTDDPAPPALPAAQDAPEFDLGLLERLVHGQVNSVREDYRLAPLRYDVDLSSISRMHSYDMASKGYFGHVSLQGTTPSMRVARGGYLCQAGNGMGITENLYAGYFYASYKLVYGATQTRVFFDWKELENVAREIVDGWMNSPPHRANLLDPSRAVHGIGITRSDDNQFFATQNLC